MLDVFDVSDVSDVRIRNEIENEMLRKRPGIERKIERWPEGRIVIDRRLPSEVSRWIVRVLSRSEKGTESAFDLDPLRLLFGRLSSQRRRHCPCDQVPPKA